MKLFSKDLMVEMMDGNISEVINIAKMFLDLGPKMIYDIEVAIETKKWISAGDIAHKLKTSLKLWQMSSLIALAEAIENNGSEPSPINDIKNNFRELKEGLNSALKQLKEEFDL